MKTKKSSPVLAVVGLILLVAGVVCSILARGGAIGEGAGDTGKLLYALSLIFGSGGPGHLHRRVAPGPERTGEPEDRRPNPGLGVSVCGSVLHWVFLFQN